MQRIPTYHGNIEKKDELDILFWAKKKTPLERLSESWRMHCVNNNIDPLSIRLDRFKASAFKRV
jgi:hypothetical protein